ncbi:MAG: alpha/beta hydrolase family protein [Blastocatellales bacterium]
MNTYLLALIMIISASLNSSSAQTSGLEGIWEGKLSAGPNTLRLVFRITKSQQGGLSAQLDSPDQGATGLPVDTVNLEGNAVRFEMKRFAATYEAKVDAGFTELTGVWKQGGVELPLVMKRVLSETKPNRPQEPQKPYPYDEEEVAYDNPKAGIRLAGTLTTPRGKGPFPAVVLITGSGPQDRNETIFGHKPFMVLADHLTRNGIAVLRVDDRGVGGSTGNISTATTEDFTEDVLAGVGFLKTRKEIDTKRIGLIGHSEGGIIAPLAATKSSDIAFIVLMAGTGLTGEEILYMQGALIVKSTGASEKDVEVSRKNQERIFAIIKSEKDPNEAEKRLMEIRDEAVAKMTEEQKKAGADRAAEAQLKSVNTPWFRYFLTYDPKPALTRVKCPVLAVNGERDLQVPYKENLEAIETALKAGGNKDVTIVMLPELNHLFQKAATGSPSEYARIEETMNPLALKTITDWIIKRTGQR